MKRKFNKTEIGDRFGRLTAIEKLQPYIYANGSSGEHWQFECDCGAIVNRTLASARQSARDKASCGSHCPAPTTREHGEAFVRGIPSKAAATVCRWCRK